MLSAYVHHHIGDPEDAADLAQEVWLRASRYAHTHQGGPMSHWLTQIAWRVILDRRGPPNVPRVATIPVASVSEVTDAGVHDLDEFLDLQHLHAIIGVLPVDQRECLVRVDVLGYSDQQAADALGLPEGTVKSRRARA